VIIQNNFQSNKNSIFNISTQKACQEAEYEGGGHKKIGKFFFAFLDELVHLEAKNKN